MSKLKPGGAGESNKEVLQAVGAACSKTRCSTVGAANCKQVAIERTKA